MRETGTDHVDLRHYLRLIWRWKWLLLFVILSIPIAVYAFSKTATKTYEAKTTLFVQATSISSPETTDPVEVSTSAPESVARLVKTPLVADVAAEALGEPDAGRSLLKQVSATLDPATGNTESNFLTIAARDSDPQRAADIAEAFGEAIATKRARDANRAIDRSIKSLSEEAPAIEGLGTTAKADLAEQLQQLRTLRSNQQSATQVVDPVVVPNTQVSPKPLRNTALALILALLIAAAMVPILDRLDRKIREPEELERLTEASLLAQIPETAFPGRRPLPESREAFQTLRASLTSFNVDQSLASVMITSPTHADGKSTVSSGLSAALAQDGRDVILVDGDLRRGQLAERLGVDAPAGLGAVLMGDRAAQEALATVSGVKGGRLRLLSAGSAAPNPSVLLGSERMTSLLAELSEVADIVIIDTPPLMIVSDAIPLLESVSGVLLVARIDHTRRDALEKAARVVSQAKGQTLGIVGTGTRKTGLYGYGEYLSSTDEDETPGPMGNGAGNGHPERSGLLSRLPGSKRS